MSRRTNLPGDGFTIGEWTVLPSLDQIVCGDRSVHLQPRLMDALVYMARRPGEVISKEEIIDSVWAQEFVANAVLTRAVSELRRALGDDGSKRRYIETIPKRGYVPGMCEEFFIHMNHVRSFALDQLEYPDAVVKEIPLSEEHSILGGGL